MANIKRVFFWNHLRSEPSSHVLHYRGGKLAASGRGLSMWFLPLSASVAEIPCDDLDQAFLFHGRSSDFQDMTTQGVITFRVINPEALSERVDFSIGLDHGLYLKAPLDQLAELLTQRAQELAWSYLAHTPVRQILAEGVEEVRSRIENDLDGDESLADMGLEIVSVRISSIAPTSELEKALQAPTREAIQQQSDEATFQRRALAVEKERAIKENELNNQIELARREEELIAQRGQNDQRRATEESGASRIDSESKAQRERLDATTRAANIREVEESRVGAEQARMAIYRDMPTGALFALAAQEIAGKLQSIEHLSITPELLGPVFQRLLDAGTKKLEADVNRN